MIKPFLFLLLSFAAPVLYAQIDRSVMPVPGPPPEVKLGRPETFSLQNGLQVLVVRDHKLPRVSLQLTLDNPPVLEGEKAGVSSLTASLLGNGSRNIPKDAFQEEVDFMGATLTFGSQGATARSLSKYFPRILELLAEAVIYPTFTEADFNTEKERLKTALKSQENDVPAIAERLQNALAYGVDHPYGEFISQESLERVSLADVTEYHRNYFVPANAYLVVIGDVTLEAVQELVTEHFTSWTRAVPPSFSYSRPRDPLFTQINVVDMPHAIQSEISVQHLVDLRMNAPDYLPALLANRILGGGAQGRLQENIREQNGYAYYAYTSLGNDKYAPATFQAITSVRNAVTDSAVVEILREIDSIGLPTIGEEELKNVKAEYTGSFVMALEKPETVARYALNIETENLPPDFFTTYLERLNAVTLGEVQEAARKYLYADPIRIVIAGKGSEIIPGLQALRYKGKAVPIRYYNKLAEPVEAPENLPVSIPAGLNKG